MAVINGFIAFFNAVQSAIEYFRDMLEIVDRLRLDARRGRRRQHRAGRADARAGPRRRRSRSRSASSPTQVGLGNIPEKIVEIIGKLRELVDKALDWLIEQALRLGQAVLDALGLGAKPDPHPAAAGAPDGEIDVDQGLKIGTEGHTLRVAVTRGRARVLMASDGFADFGDRMRKLEASYHAEFAKSPASAGLDAKLKVEVAGILTEADTLQKAAEAIKPPGFGKPSPPNAAEPRKPPTPRRCAEA